MAAGIPLRRQDDLIAGRALFHDYTSQLRSSSEGPEETGCAALDGATLERSAEDAAEVLFGLAKDHDFTLHEHFLTDLAGHRGTEDERVFAAQRIEALAGRLALGADRHEVLVLMVSDHGNLEDLTVRTHTLNPVPYLAWGPGAEEAVSTATDLTHVTPTILAALGL